MNINSYLEHTFLKSDSNPKAIQSCVTFARDNNLAGVCIPPYYVKEVRSFLQEDHPTKIVSVVGFPMGYNTTSAKVEEIKRLVNDGVDEIDGVINLAAIKSGNWNYFRNDSESIMRASKLKGKIVKLIIEAALLTPEELKQVCSWCTEIGVDYIKTSSGQHGIPTTPEMIASIRSIIGDQTKIKASGGIREYTQAVRLIEAGANRIGSSNCPNIIHEIPVQ